MKFKLHLLVAAILAGSVSLAPAAPAPHIEKEIFAFDRIEIRNFEDEVLGRITDLGIDLINGRIVEVLVVSDNSLDMGNKIVALPPLALYPDQFHQIYRINVSTEVFKRAAAIDLSQWTDAGRSDRVAAAYRLFGREPYFLVEGETPDRTARPKVALGYVERSSKIMNMPVGNFENESFGHVWSLSLDIAKGRIRHVVVLAPGNFKTKTIIPAMALSFNPARDALLLDATKLEYADEPRYILTEAAYGQDAYYTEETYEGPRTTTALEQGTSYRDVDRTVLINKGIRAAKLAGSRVEVGTLHDRVTLRGWVASAKDKRRVGQIAVAAARAELVDNQIVVRKPTAAR